MWQDTKNDCHASKTALAQARDPSLNCSPFWDLIGCLSAFLQEAFTANLPVSYRIAYRNPWPLVDPDHQGNDVIPHRVSGCPEKECRHSDIMASLKNSVLGHSP